MKQQATGERHWYAIHTYSGYENAVLRNLKQRIDSLGMDDKIFNVVVPTEKKIKIKGGKRVEVEEKIYPGYVLVEMIVTDDSWFIVRNTPRVTGFVVTNAASACLRMAIPPWTSWCDCSSDSSNGLSAKHPASAAAGTAMQV